MLMMQYYLLTKRNRFEAYVYALYSSILHVSVTSMQCCRFVGYYTMHAHLNSLTLGLGCLKSMLIFFSYIIILYIYMCTYHYTRMLMSQILLSVVF